MGKLIFLWFGIYRGFGIYRKQNQDFRKYKEAQTNREVRRLKRKNWRYMCESIESSPETARLQKVLSKDHTNGLGTMKNNDGSYTTNTQETLELMMKTHFPGSLSKTDRLRNQNIGISSTSKQSERSNVETTDIASIFTHSKIEWALASFESFKTPGLDGIYPAHLQKCKETVIPILITLFKSSFLIGYIPTK